MATQSHLLARRKFWGLAYVWSGIAVMWAFWLSFVVFLSSPNKLMAWWPLPTVDHGGMIDASWQAGAIDILLIALFGLQHSLMARPSFKSTVMRKVPTAFERVTYVHMANIALFALIMFWQPIPIEVWDVGRGVWRDAIWMLFASGWLILLGRRGDCLAGRSAG